MGRSTDLVGEHLIRASTARAPCHGPGGAAAWTFVDHDDRFKKSYLREMWFQGSPNLPQPQSQYQSPKEMILPWHTVWVPPAVKRLLPKQGRDDFSSVEKLAAAIQWFTTLPLGDRLDRKRSAEAVWPGEAMVCYFPISSFPSGPSSLS
jgi:hypothetical protein